jgi:Zn finger protein HypA/HybF involved in hydrogenase expression
MIRECKGCGEDFEGTKTQNFCPECRSKGKNFIFKPKIYNVDEYRDHMSSADNL